MTRTNEPAGDPARGEPFRLMDTLAIAAFVVVGYFGTQAGVFFAWAAALVRSRPGLEFPAALNEVSGDGSVLALATLAGATVGCWLLVAIVGLRRRGPSLAEYLALQPVPARTLAAWSAAFAALMFVIDRGINTLEQPIVSEEMVAVYSSASTPVFFWVGFVLAAPLFEELFFRGFLYAGLARTRMGAAGAVLVTTFVWARLHMQYEPWVLLVLLLLGLALGAARAMTGSVLPPLVMHVLNNTLAMWQTASRASGS